MPSYYVDLTPYVPLLTDGKPHDITIDVASAEPDHAINSNWIISANLQVVTGSSSEPTTGEIVSRSVEPFAQTTDSLLAIDGGVEITTKAIRKLRIESEIISGNGLKKRVVWSQDLVFSNTQWYSNDALVEVPLPFFIMPEPVADISANNRESPRLHLALVFRPTTGSHRASINSPTPCT